MNALRIMEAAVHMLSASTHLEAIRVPVLEVSEATDSTVQVSESCNKYLRVCRKKPQSGGSL